MLARHPVSRGFGRLLRMLLRLAQVILTLGSIGILFTRSDFMAISLDLFGADAPLMNTVWLDRVMHPYAAIPVSMWVVIYLYHRHQVLSESRKLVLDAGYTLLMAGWLSLLLAGLYGPVVS